MSMAAGRTHPESRMVHVDKGPPADGPRARSPSETADGMLDRLVAFVAEAAVHALALRGSGLVVSHKGADLAQALTQADTDISAMLQGAFAPRLIEEETAAMSLAAARTLLNDEAWSFIGDPVDGTANFAAGLTGWGTMVCACSAGWPRVGAALLPCWDEPRFLSDAIASPSRGVLLAATEDEAFWAPTLDGRPEALRPIPAPARRSGHVGWNAIAAQHWTLDYARGFFPLCEGGYVADVVALAAGRMEATTFNHKLWDLAPTWPVLRALGFHLFRWPDLAGPPATVVDMFDDRFACHPDLWIVARDVVTAGRLAAAIKRAG